MWISDNARRVRTEVAWSLAGCGCHSRRRACLSPYLRAGGCAVYPSGRPGLHARAIGACCVGSARTVDATPTGPGGRMLSRPAPVRVKAGLRTAQPVRPSLCHQSVRLFHVKPSRHAMSPIKPERSRQRVSASCGAEVCRIKSMWRRPGAYCWRPNLSQRCRPSAYPRIRIDPLSVYDLAHCRDFR